jgi:hypothetical protein
MNGELFQTQRIKRVSCLFDVYELHIAIGVEGVAPLCNGRIIRS